LTQSLSVGVVSATDRTTESLTQFKIDGVIQTDASVNPGNSGGPLLDADARVVGINQQIASQSGGNEGIAFAVPIRLVSRSLDGHDVATPGDLSSEISTHDPGDTVTLKIIRDGETKDLDVTLGSRSDAPGGP